jgi:arsenate reductase-like glutaredoxin family protein
MTFEMKADGKTYSVKDPDGNFKDWTVIKQESFKLDKSTLILDKFKKDFPQYKIDDYEFLTRACSRSKEMTQWLINANLEYADEAQTPLFAKDIIEPGHFKQLQSKITEISKVISKQSLKKRELADKYKSDLKDLENEEKILVNKIKGDDKYVKILSLNSTYLPFTLQIQIEGYVPKDKENLQESRDVFARETLIQYKRTLCQMVKDNPKVDIDGVIESNLLK